MSLSALNQVYDEVRRLAVAGSALAAGDFRLKKLIPPLEKSGEKAPVFAKVAQAVQRLVDAGPKESAAAMLDLNSLTTAILYTQGETGKAGEFRPIVSSNTGLTIADTSARTLKPLLEALTTTGSGRLEVIKDAHERGAFKDLRLMKPALQAIDDPYPEIGEYVMERILPAYGLPIYDEVKSGLNLKGKASDGRRLKLLHALDRAATKPLVEQALDEGAKEVKLAAIECLRGSSEAIPFLLEQAKAKVKEVRHTALRALCGFSDDVVVDALQKALQTDDVGAIDHLIAKSPSQRLRDFVLSEAARVRDEVFGGPGKEEGKKPAKKAAKKAAPAKGATKGAAKAAPAAKAPLRQLRGLLGCLRGWQHPATVELLVDLFDRRGELIKVKGDDSGEDVLDDVIQMIPNCGSQPALQGLAEAWASLSSDRMAEAFMAAARFYPPAELYDRFSPVLLAGAGSKGRSKGAVEASDRSEQIQNELDRIAGRQRHLKQRQASPEGLDEEDRYIYDAKLDPRWLDAAIKLDAEDKDLVLELSRPNHPELEKYFAAYAESQLKPKTFDPDWDFGKVLQRMLDFGHARGVEFFLAAIQRKTLSWHWQRTIGDCVSHLPESALPQVEALLPNLPENVMETIAAALEERRLRSQ